MSCSDAGFHGPGGVLLLPTVVGTVACWSGDGQGAVERVGEFLCPRPGLADTEDHVAGVADQADSGVQQPMPQRGGFGVGHRPVEQEQPHPAQQVDGQGGGGDPGGIDGERG